MNKYILSLFGLILLSSCATTIPMQANLSDQILLLAKNKPIKANYEINSLVKDGSFKTISVQKNGVEYESDSYTKYASETAFNKIWTSYFQAKFNSFASDEMVIKITLEKLYIRNSSSTSIAGYLLTGNNKYNAEAVAVVSLELNYKGENYQNKFEISASDYNESQYNSVGNYSWVSNETNPTRQQALLLESAINKSILQFDNFISSITVNE